MPAGRAVQGGRSRAVVSAGQRVRQVSNVVLLVTPSTAISLRSSASMSSACRPCCREGVERLQAVGPGLASGTDRQPVHRMRFVFALAVVLLSVAVARPIQSVK